VTSGSLPGDCSPIQMFPKINGWRPSSPDLLYFRQVWCGPQVCASPQMSNDCPTGETCHLLGQDECFVPRCSTRGLCRPPSGDYGLPEPVESCSPNRPLVQSENCARLTYKFDMEKLAPVSEREGVILSYACLTFDPV